jgi:hypothetical protein
MVVIESRLFIMEQKFQVFVCGAQPHFVMFMF